MQPQSFFTSSSSSSSSASSSGSYRSTSTPHLFALSAAAALQPELDPVFPSSFPSASLSSAAHSLSGLTLEQEEARLSRLATRRAAAAAMDEQRLQDDEEEAERQRAGLPRLSSLPLSPPSPTPSLCSSSAFLSSSAGGQQKTQLRPSSSCHLWTGSSGSLPAAARSSGASALSAARFSVSRVSSPQPVPAHRHAGEGRGVLCGGRALSARQRQQMAFTERLSPTPLEEPEEDEEEELKGGRKDERAGRGSSAHTQCSSSRTRSASPCSRADCWLSLSSAETVAAASSARTAQPPPARRLLSSRPRAVICTGSSLPPSPSPPLLPAASPTSASNPLLSAILYVHTLISTSPADAAGLRVRDFIVEIAHFSKAAGWTPNMLGAVAAAIHAWPAQHPGQSMRIVVLRRVPHEQADTLPDVTWARTKLNGSGNGHGGAGGGSSNGGSRESGGAGPGGGNGSGNGKGESVIALQRLVLWPVIGHYQIDEQQGGESGGVLGCVLCCYPDPVPISPPLPPSQQQQQQQRCPQLQQTATTAAAPASSQIRGQQAAGGAAAATAGGSPSSALLSSLAAAPGPAPPRYTSAQYPQHRGSHMRSIGSSSAFSAARPVFAHLDTPPVSPSRWVQQPAAPYRGSGPLPAAHCTAAPSSHALSSPPSSASCSPSPASSSSSNLPHSQHRPF